jgi:hypothetical protein
MGFLAKVVPYSVVTLSLEAVRVNEAQGPLTIGGVQKADWIANTLTVLELDGATLSVRLDRTQNDEIPLSQGLTIAGVAITELYWTNVGQAGKTAKIFVAWVD